MTDPDRGSILLWKGITEAKPIHFHPNASALDYRPFDRHTSSIYRTSVNLFRTLGPEQIRMIFRYRHILIYGIEHEEDWAWTRSSMEQICPLNVLVGCESKLQTSSR